MAAVLSIRSGVPSELSGASVGTLPEDGADWAGGGGRLPAGGESSAAGQFAVAGPLSGRRDLRARATERHRAAGSATGPALGGTPRGCGESPPGAASGP